MSPRSFLEIKIYKLYIMEHLETRDLRTQLNLLGISCRDPNTKNYLPRKELARLLQVGGSFGPSPRWDETYAYKEARKRGAQFVTNLGYFNNKCNETRQKDADAAAYRLCNAEAAKVRQANADKRKKLKCDKKSRFFSNKKRQKECENIYDKEFPCPERKIEKDRTAQENAQCIEKLRQDYIETEIGQAYLNWV